MSPMPKSPPNASFQDAWSAGVGDESPDYPQAAARLVTRWFGTQSVPINVALTMGFLIGRALKNENR